MYAFNLSLYSVGDVMLSTNVFQSLSNPNSFSFISFNTKNITPSKMVTPSKEITTSEKIRPNKNDLNDFKVLELINQWLFRENVLV